MTNSIGAINSPNIIHISSGSAKTALTPETKAKLEALGIDTTNIKTEAEGQAILKAAEVNPKEIQKAHAPKGCSSIDSIRAEAIQLASKVGVSVSGNDKIDDILNKIAYKINELKVSAGHDQNKLAQINQYQSELDLISSEFLSMKSSHAQLSNGMDALASYNKIFQNIS